MDGEQKEIVETATLPNCKEDVEHNNGIADTIPVPSHSKAYNLFNKLTMAESTRWLHATRLSAASPQAIAQHGDDGIYQTDAVARDEYVITPLRVQYPIYKHRAQGS